MTQALPMILAAAAGVLLPKLLPAVALPTTLPRGLAMALDYIPAAMLGAFTVIIGAGFAMPSSNPPLVVGALAGTAAAALVTRRSFPSLLVGWGVIAALHVAGMV